MVSAITDATDEVPALTTHNRFASEPAYKGANSGDGSMRRLLALSLLLLALAVVATPAVFALLALLRGDVDGALAVFGIVLLIPLGFVVVGVYFSLKHYAGGDRGEER